MSQILQATHDHLKNQTNMAGYSLSLYNHRNAISIGYPSRSQYLALITHPHGSEQVTLVLITPAEPELLHKATRTTKETVPINNPSFLEIINSIIHKHFA